jgi:CDK inhibitor PHO81
MKFGKEISGLASGDPWAPFYLDYKGLKKIINSLAKGRPLDAALLAAVHRPRRIEDTEYNLLPFQPDESTLLQTHRAAFFFKLERELEKINEFYLNKEAESKLRLQNLIDKRKRLQEAVVQSGFHLNRGSSSFVALHEGFRFFERDLAKLQAFIDVK